MKTLLILLCLCLSGCIKPTPQPVRPIEFDLGAKGVAPTRVWEDFDYVILSTNLYLKTVKNEPIQ